MDSTWRCASSEETSGFGSSTNSTKLPLPGGSNGFNGRLALVALPPILRSGACRIPAGGPIGRALAETVSASDVQRRSPRGYRRYVETFRGVERLLRLSARVTTECATDEPAPRNAG
jgi:hypothetical protein